MTYNSNQRSKTDTADSVGAAIFGIIDALFTMVRYVCVYLWRHPEVLTVLSVAFVVSWTPAPTWLCWTLGLLSGVFVFWKFRTRLIQRRSRMAVKGNVQEVLAIQPPWATTRPSVTVTKPASFQDSLESDTNKWRK